MTPTQLGPDFSRIAQRDTDDRDEYKPNDDHRRAKGSAKTARINLSDLEVSTFLLADTARCPERIPFQFSQTDTRMEICEKDTSFHTSR